MDWNGITDNSDLSLRSVRKKTALKSRSVTNRQKPYLEKSQLRRSKAGEEQREDTGVKGKKEIKKERRRVNKHQ